MADQVNIENVGGENGVASEITLQKLLASMELMANKIGADNKMAIKKANEQYKKSISDLNKATKKSTKARKENTDAVEDSTDAHKAHTSMLSGPVMSALGKLAGSVINLGGELLNGGNKIGDFSQHLPYLGDALKPIMKFADNSIDTFRELSSTGASFNNSLVEMRYASAAAQLNLDEFAGLISSNTDTLRMMGGTVQAGVREFTNLNKGLKEVGGWHELKTLGFTVEEINEGMLGYANLQMRLGQRERMTQEEMIQGSREYMRELDLISKATGMQRKEIEEGLAANAADASFRAMANNFEAGSEEAANFRKSMMLTNRLPAEMQTVVKDLADGVAQTDLGQKFAALAPNVTQRIQEALQKGLDPRQFIDAFKGLEGIDERILGGVGPNAAATAQAFENLVPGVSTLANLEPELRKFSEMNLDAAQSQQDATDQTTSAMVTFEESVRALRAQVHTSLLETNIFQAVGGGMEIVNSGLDSAATGLGDLTQSLKNLKNEDIGSMAEYIGDNVQSAVINFFTDPRVIAAGVAGITGLFAAAAIKSAIIGGVTKMLTGKSITGALATALSGAGSKIKGLATAGAGLAKSGLGKGKDLFKSMGGAKGLGKTALKGLKFIPGVGLIVAGGMAAGEGISAAFNAEEYLGLAEDQAATGAQKLASGIGGVVDSLSFGLIEGQNVAKGLSDMFGMGADAVEEQKSKLEKDAAKLSSGNVAQVQSMNRDLKLLSNLDPGEVDSYRLSVEQLVGTLEDLNTQLAGGTDKSGMFGDDTRPDFNAGDLLSQSSKSKSQDQVNTSALLRVLEEIREINKRTLRAINESGNVY